MVYLLISSFVACQLSFSSCSLPLQVKGVAMREVDEGVKELVDGILYSRTYWTLSQIPHARADLGMCVCV